MTAGVNAAGFTDKLWSLEDLDHPSDPPIVGQFIPQGVTKDVGAVIPTGTSVGQPFPFVQWVAGELEVIRFSARFWATDMDDFTVEDRLEKMEDLVKRNSDLARPPVCAFSWGDVPNLAVDCLVKSIGGITYDEVRDDGSLRGVTLQVQLVRFEPPDFEVTDPSAPETFTRIRRAKKGDTYESIALLEFGVPLYGVLLRQLNPRIPGMQLADLQAKDPVHIFPEDYLVTLDVDPEFHAFKTGSGNESAEARRREMFDDRNGDAYSTIYGDTADEEFV